MKLPSPEHGFPDRSGVGEFRTNLDRLGPPKKIGSDIFEVLFGDFENFEIFEVQVARVRLPDNPHG